MSKTKYMNVNQVKDLIRAEEAEIEMAFATTIHGVMPKGWVVLDKEDELTREFVLPAEMVTFEDK